MLDRFDGLFGQLLMALQSAEKRHRSAYGKASDNNEWDIADCESASALRITNWRRTLDALRTEILAAGVVDDNDVGEAILPYRVESVLETQRLSILPLRADDERIGRYVYQKMCELSEKKHTFSADELADLQDAKWSSEVLNLPWQFFILTTDEVKYYWKRDTFTFNGMKFRLCMLWYNDQYRGRSQRECFDLWYDNLGANTVTSPVNSVNSDEETADDVKVGKHIRNKLRELSHKDFVFTNDQIIAMCSAEWSHKTFTYNRILPFAKIFIALKEISEQAKDERGYNRYWDEVFSFGEYKLLIVSQWYAKDKDSFDEWYDSLADEAVHDAVRIEADESDDLQQESSITGTKPISLKLLRKTYAVRSWTELYIRVCEILLIHRPYVMAGLDSDAQFNSERRTNFSYIQSEIKFNRKRLSNGLWIETNKNSADILNTCYRLLEKCEFSPDELCIETMEGQV